MDDESYAQESMNEVPKSPKGPPPDDENVWTDAPEKKHLLILHSLSVTDYV